MITNEILLKTLKDFYIKTNCVPKKTDFNNRSTYCRRFGSWLKALEAAKIPFKVKNIKILKTCAVCKSNTYNNTYCSKKCSNIGAPRRVAKIKICKKCNINKVKDIRRRCELCKVDRSRLNKTIKQISLSGSNRYSSIREHARLLYLKPDALCQKCNYAKHIEVCHIKPISKFPEDTLLSVVNAKENILLLCPNCHWELDNL